MSLSFLSIRPSLASRLRRVWICTSCRANLSTTTIEPQALPDRRKPFYVTTPIFYVNADPHVGHLYSMVLADVVKRFHLLRGEKALLSTGIDEHGLKVQKAALKAGIDRQEFCDSGAEVFKSLAHRANVSYDYFARTTDPKHKTAVQYAWMLLKEKGYIYESKHEGWYSVGDEAFYPESAIELAVDPVTGRKRHVSTETGREVEWTSEINYKFRLSRFRDQLLEFYAQNPTWIEPQSRMNEVLNAVNERLDDLSVSRPTSRVQWGIQVPDDPTQSIYVWLDALLNYAVQAGYPFQTVESFAGGWPADVHVIGKDISRFHCVYWPAFLMALNLPLPKRVLSHGHWTIGMEKMSKSTGNVVDPFNAIHSYGPDVVRWYLAMDGRIGADADWNNHRLVVRYQTLKGGLGNFAGRVIRSWKSWSIQAAVRQVFANGAEMPNNIRGSEEDAALWDAIAGLSGQVEARFEGYNVPGALQDIMVVIGKTNAWFHNSAPWRYATPESDPEQMTERLASIVALAGEALRICGILLLPYMPGKATQLLDQLGVAEDKRGLKDAVMGGDLEYGWKKEKRNGKKKYEGVLFPPIVTD